MSNVLLLGAFGQGNPGDEALCAAFVDALSDHELVVASSDPRATTTRHGVDAIPATAASVGRAVRAADALVIGGGTIFKSLHASTGRGASSLLRNTAAVIALARASGTKVAMAGVGAGDLRGRRARRWARWIAPHIDLLVLRDEESAAVLVDAGVPAPFWIGADPAWLLRPDAESVASATPDHEESVTVAVSHLAGDGSLTEAMAAALARLPSGFRVRLQPWQRGGADGDQRVAEEVRDRLATGGRPATIIDAPTDLSAAVASLAGERLVVAMRFHALVAAGMAGVRSVAVAHEPKLAGVARRLEQVAVPAHATTEVLDGALRDALAHDPPNATVIEEEVARAAHVFTLVDLLLTGGRMEHPELVRGLPLSNGIGSW